MYIVWHIYNVVLWCVNLFAYHDHSTTYAFCEYAHACVRMYV